MRIIDPPRFRAPIPDFSRTPMPDFARVPVPHFMPLRLRPEGSTFCQHGFRPDICPYCNHTPKRTPRRA